MLSGGKSRNPPSDSDDNRAISDLPSHRTFITADKESFGRFELIEKIGSGASGTVFLVVETDTKTQYERGASVDAARCPANQNNQKVALSMDVTLPSTSHASEHENETNSSKDVEGPDAHSEDERIEGIKLPPIAPEKPHLLRDKFISEGRKLFVLKRISFADDDTETKRKALCEAACLSSFEHPHIIQLVDSWATPTAVHLVTEWGERGDLDQYLKSTSSSLPESQVLGWLAQLALAVEYLHSMRLLHRDIKSPNIFIMKDSTLKLGDFGAAYTLQHTNDCAHTQIGTPYYLSPEICNGLPYSSASDMWALGVVAFELLARTRPFTGSNIAVVVLKIVGKSPPRLPTVYSIGLRKLVRRLLHKQPENRLTIQQLLNSDTLRKAVAHLRGMHEPTRIREALLLAKDRDTAVESLSDSIISSNIDGDVSRKQSTRILEEQDALSIADTEPDAVSRKSSRHPGRASLKAREAGSSNAISQSSAAETASAGNNVSSGKPKTNQVAPRASKSNSASRQRGKDQAKDASGSRGAARGIGALKPIPSVSAAANAKRGDSSNVLVPESRQAVLRALPLSPPLPSSASAPPGAKPRLPTSNPTDARNAKKISLQQRENVKQPVEAATTSSGQAEFSAKGVLPNQLEPSLNNADSQKLVVWQCLVCYFRNLPSMQQCLLCFADRVSGGLVGLRRLVPVKPATRDSASASSMKVISGTADSSHGAKGRDVAGGQGGSNDVDTNIQSEAIVPTLSASLDAPAAPPELVASVSSGLFIDAATAASQLGAEPSSTIELQTVSPAVSGKLDGLTMAAAARAVIESSPHVNAAADRGGDYIVDGDIEFPSGTGGRGGEREDSETNNESDCDITADRDSAGRKGTRSTGAPEHQSLSGAEGIASRSTLSSDRGGDPLPVHESSYEWAPGEVPSVVFAAGEMWECPGCEGVQQGCVGKCEFCGYEYEVTQ